MKPSFRSIPAKLRTLQTYLLFKVYTAIIIHPIQGQLASYKASLGCKRVATLKQQQWQQHKLITDI